jgi:hypothetical protein
MVALATAVTALQERGVQLPPVLKTAQTCMHACLHTHSSALLPHHRYTISCYMQDYIVHVHQQASLAEGHPPDPYQSTVKSLSAALVLVLMPGRTHSSAACQVHRVSMTAQQYIVPGNMAFLWRGGAEGLDVLCVCLGGGGGAEGLNVQGTEDLR